MAGGAGVDEGTAVAVGERVGVGVRVRVVVRVGLGIAVEVGVREGSGEGLTTCIAKASVNVTVGDTVTESEGADGDKAGVVVRLAALVDGGAWAPYPPPGGLPLSREGRTSPRTALAKTTIAMPNALFNRIPPSRWVAHRTRRPR